MRTNIIQIIGFIVIVLIILFALDRFFPTKPPIDYKSKYEKSLEIHNRYVDSVTVLLKQNQVEKDSIIQVINNILNTNSYEEDVDVFLDPSIVNDDSVARYISSRIDSTRSALLRLYSNGKPPTWLLTP